MFNHTLQHKTLGSQLTGTLDGSGQIVRYRGIKYASVAKRWTRSQILEEYPARIDATKFGPRCPQQDAPNHTRDFGPFLPFEHNGQDDLDCLNLNVTCPKDLEAPVPVLVWIHGGSLHWGAGSDPIWEPTRLVKASMQADSPIVVVTINYRLSMFGFLAPHDPADPSVSRGNFGFHDQVNALEWCQRHIAGFGGDPRRVTIGGESAGGCSTHAMIAYQEKLGEQRYFRRAIMQSGNFAVMGFWDRGRLDQIWRDAVQELDLEGTAQELEAMRQLPWEKLVQSKALDTGGYGVSTDGLFLSPPTTSAGGGFLERPTSTVDAVMHGDNADEGNIFRDAAAQPGALEHLKRVGAEVLGATGCAKLLSVYGLDEQALRGLDEKEMAWRLHRIPEDARFYLPSDELIRVWPRAAFYHLTAKSPFKQSSDWPEDSYHTLDLLYLFGNFDQNLAADGLTGHLRLGHEIRSKWISFIYGEEPWRGAFEGTAATIGIEGTTYGPVASCREWDGVRLERLQKVKELGFLELVQIATTVFP